MWVLLIVWTGNFVATAQTITFESEELCQKGRTAVLETWSPINQRSELKVEAVCVEIKN